MFNCCGSGCARQFKDVRSFNAHCKLAHQSLSKYTCQFDNCRNKYSVYNAFRRHLIIGHHVPIFATEEVPSHVSTNVEHDFVTDHFEEAVNDPPQSSELSSDIPSISRDYKRLLEDQENNLVAKLYSNPAYPRNLVNIVITLFYEHFEQVVTSSLDPNLSPHLQNEIAGMFKVLKNPFCHLKTEYMRLKHFESCGSYIPPISYEIDCREERARSKDGVTIRMKSVTGEFIPLGKLLTKFFQLPDVFADTMSYMQYLKSKPDLLLNLTQCDRWKEKVSKFSEQDIAIPLNCYYDEVEPNKALGPHCEPLGCTYIQVASLPPAWSSKLENIFLALLFDAHNRTVYSNHKCFRPLINELILLETKGIIVSIPGFGDVKLYFVVAFLLGDNKGLNGVCGFVECFTSNHYCRECFCTKEVARSMFVEDVSLLRTPENYQADLLFGDSSVTGIKEECIFNQLPSFETPTDIALDEFHDLIEGVAHYTFVPVLRHFHNLNSLFISTLNDRLYYFDLGVDSDNRPPLINLDILLKKEKLKMTGAEMVTFIRIFGVLVHDMVPENDPYYELYLLLHAIASMLQAKRMPRNFSTILALKVKDHNRLYCEITKLHLKPKHHFLLHYARSLSILGPFSNLSTIRFEAKHRLITMSANSCMSRVNLAHTVAIKHQLGFCFRVVSNRSIRQDIDHGPMHVVDLSELDTYPSFKLTLSDDIFEEPKQ
ncbi:Zinc finger protein 653 [Frankliniella fusca]|uniref:Zinc finger protein 653 n=1 Tax=Frankliniella fusca TaxID=407009 RepID=A0AAE1HY92_9NEOP|nr:Zinc finger protein 653 [Frankliniella fusca]